MHTYVGVDTGATSTRIWDGGRLAPVLTTPTNYSEYIDLLLAQLRDFVSGPICLAVAVPGVVRDNRLVAAANLDSTWMGQDIGQDLVKRDSRILAATVLQDTKAAGHAARAHDLNQSDSALLLTISTGLGGAWMTPDFVRPLEIGHMPINLSGEANQCGCLQLGCVEADLSGTALIRRTGSAASEIDDALFWHRYGIEFGEFLATVVPLFAADAVVLMGGVATLFERFLDIATERLDELLCHVPMPTIRVTAFGMEIGAVGAYERALTLRP